MKRFGGWLNGKPAHHSLSTLPTPLEEEAALHDALKSAALIMNDEIAQAEEELARGSSVFHKLGEAVATFMRAVLGFEKEVMKQAGITIAEAENAAYESQRRAIADPSTAHRSAIYPPGAEYALCLVQAQIMSAVVGVLNESLTESLRGFYKLRKAINTLNELHQSEERYMKLQRTSNASTVSQVTPSSPTGKAALNGHATPHEHPVDSPLDFSDEDDDLAFEDAADELPETTEGADYQGRVSYSNPRNSQSQPRLRSATEQANMEVDIAAVLSHPFDIFIHSGVNCCFGLLKLLLSMMPPSFDRILSIFSFRGDREQGFRMLWSATSFKTNINGAMAGLVVLGFHNAPLSFCDILPKDAIPEARLSALLSEMRELYPKSKLWLLEESRLYSRQRQLESAIDIINNAPKSPLKQIEAVGIFETSLMLMYLHRYEECAESFVKCVGLNNWSHALYYYIAAVCYVELYRIHKSSDPEKAQEYAVRAEKYFREVPQHTGKRRFIGRQLPFDTFVARKIPKWEARAASRQIRLIDAVGVSPVVEMIYFWSGFRRMRVEHVQQALERLAWSETGTETSHWSTESPDERAILSVLRGICYRSMGETGKAKAVLAEEVISQNLHTLKSCEYPDTWPLPVAHYEKAVCFWEEAGGEDGDKKLLAQCSNEIAIVEKWESYDLEARVGLKVRAARETLRKAGVESR